MAIPVGIPRAVQVVLDDVGWRDGWRLDAEGGPYRAGIDRQLEPADYAAIADLGQRLGIRPSAALILCEWDRRNACARQPTSTMQGAAWDNRERAGDWSDAAAAIFRGRAAHLELALHGVGHEHWDDAGMTRAEWSGSDGRKWRDDDLRGHLDLFTALLDQHELGPEAGHSFPRHFVPCAFCYLWDEDDPTDTGALMAGAGVELVSLPFSSGGFHRRQPLLAPDGGVNHGRLVIDRGGNGVPWFALDQVPAAVMGIAADPADELLGRLAQQAELLPADELELLFARRGAARPEDHERLLAAHLPAALAVVHLYRGRGLAPEQLAAAAQAGLDEALRSYDPAAGVASDRFVEELVRRRLQEALPSAGPALPAAARGGHICGLHWPNVLSADPAENEQATDHWVDYLKQVGEQPGQYLAGNVFECCAQWAYHTWGQVTSDEASVTIDLARVPPEVARVIGHLPVVVEVGGYTRIGALSGDGARPVWYRRQGPRALLGVKVGFDQPGVLRAAAEPGPLEPIVFREGTYNVLDLRETAAGIEIDLEVFGTQRITVVPGFEPGELELRGALRLGPIKRNVDLGLLAVSVSAHDLQGERGTLLVRRPN